jgi:5-(aminomethyl)-3-furanmethanol phosphate kinase
MDVDWVVKVGGSLFPKDAIKLCKALLGRNILIICGGGIFADKIRDYDKEMHFSNSANHKAAIICMDILGVLVADRVNGAEPVYSLEEARRCVDQGKLPVLLPHRLLEYLDPLEHSWRVTSDSLSLAIARHLEAKLLIATDVDGIYTDEPSSDGAQLIKTISAKKLLNFGQTSVDEILAELLLQYKSDCYVVNGKHPERVISVMEGKNSRYTFIGGNLNG